MTIIAFPCSFREKKFVALKVVKSAAHYTETALDEIKLLKCVSRPYYQVPFENFSSAAAEGI